MNVRRLALLEIRFRRLGFLLAVVAVAVAVACLVTSVTMLHAYDLRTQQIIAVKEAETKAQMQQMEDDYRKITLKLGFNIIILPKTQQLSDFYAEDFAAKTMPESYASRLSESGAMTVAHLLPVLQQRVRWPERQRLMLLTGTRGEVPIVGEATKKPILEALPPNSVVLGYELHRSLGLEKGDRVAMFGKTLTVSQCNPERGTKDDITAWMDLEAAQDVLKQPGKINAIFALSCFCQGDRLATIRKEIAKTLPETQVIEFASQAVTRAETRARAQAAAEESLAAERRQRDLLKRERENLAAILVPLAILGCAVWVGLLAFGNVRERQSEIGILRAVGMRSRQVLGLFLWRAVMIGVAGAVIGYAAGFLISAFFGRDGSAALWLFDPRLFTLVLLFAPVLSVVACWVPAQIAAQEDPALVLCRE